MSIYVILSNYFDNGFFGAYTSIKRARKVLEHFFEVETDIVSFEDIDDYCYQFTTVRGTTYTIEICWDVLDAEFEEGMLKEDE